MTVRKAKKTKKAKKPSPPKGIPESLKRKIMIEAVQWGERNKLGVPFTVSEPVRDDCGFLTVITEDQPPKRSVSARFDRSGNPTLWEMMYRG